VEHVGPLDLDCDPAVVLGVLQLELVHLTERGSCDRFSFGVEVQENVVHSFTAKQTIVTIVYRSEKYFLSFQLSYCTFLGGNLLQGIITDQTYKFFLSQNEKF
jgi:hypothetical protein